jgi:predicted aspartyl protease
MTKVIRAVPFLLLVLLFPALSNAQFPDTCETHSLLAMKDEAAGKSSLLCKGVADLALGRLEEGQKILRQVIQQAPHSDIAFEGHERLLGFFARSGHMREASREVSALLTIRPTDSVVLSDSSFYEAVGHNPDMTVSSLGPVSFSAQLSGGSLNIPFTVKGKKASFFLDTGAEFSVISDTEANALGLTVIPVETKMQDSGGSMTSIKIADVEHLDIGPIHLKHVPFLVVPASNPPFNEMPRENQGLLGIQIAVALRTIRLERNGQLDLAFPSRPDAQAEQITFDDTMPVLHVTFKGSVIPFTFDTGAERTILNQPFARDFPDVVAQGIKKDHDMIGLGGTATLHAIELPTWRLTLGKETISIDNISVLLEKGNDYSKWAAGNLGINALNKCEPFTIDFTTMHLSTGE